MRRDVNYPAADRGSPTSPSSSSVTRDECVVGMQLRSHDLNTDVAHSNVLPEPLLAAPLQQSRILNLADSISKPAGSGPSA